MTEEERLFHIYELMHERVAHWDRLLTERTNMFVLISSILFAGFAALVGTSPQLLGKLLVVALCIAGIFLSTLLWAVNYGGIRELRVYINLCRGYELNEDVFEFLRKKQPERGGFIALDQWYSGKTVCGITPLTGWKKAVVSLFSSWNVYPWLIPALFFFLWLISLTAYLWHT